MRSKSDEYSKEENERVNNKSQYWQVVRGICILAVIAIHCPQGTDGDLYTWLGIRQLIDFPVALFIFMAGYFVKPEKVDITWQKNRGGCRLLIPFLIWSSIYTVKNAVFAEMSIKGLVVSFVTGKATAPLYYILVLIQLTLLTPLLKKRNKWLCLITPMYLIFLYAYNITTGNMPRFYETVFPAWFVFYILGMDARTGKLKKIRVKGWMIALALVASCVECYALMKIGCSSGFACSQIRFTPFIYTALIAMCLSQNVKDVKENILSKIGDCSFGIFFSHMLFLWVISKGLSVIGVDVWIVKWVLCFVLTAVTSFAFVLVVRKIFEGKKILRYIGFE